MSTPGTTPTATAAPPAPAATLPPPPPRTTHGPREIKLVSHSPIFYWWPIWLLGYVLAIITGVENHRLAILPADTKVTEVQALGDDKQKTYQFQVPSDKVTKSLGDAVTNSKSGEKGAQAFAPHVSEKPWMGPVYCVVLILTILITNIPLRGLWSFLVILMMVVLALVFSVFDAWEPLLRSVGNLHIYINMAGYIFIATTVLILWVVSVFIFDQRTYMVVEPGQIRVCEHIGASIRNIPANRVEFEKQRDDLFRHWILGFFSGDLIIKIDKGEEIRLPNVLWIGWRLEEVQKVLRETATVNYT